MTNEEKAREIIGGDCKKENCLECGGKYSAEEGGCVTYQRIMQIAEWKDEQFAKEKQALIDKACEWWESEIIYPTMTQAEKDWFEARIEAFKIAMKGE